jgi:hypothetical protein
MTTNQDQMDLEQILIRIIEMGHGREAVPAIESAVAELLARPGNGDGGFELDDLLQELAGVGEGQVVEWIRQAIADLITLGGPLTEMPPPTSPRPEHTVCTGPFEILPRAEWTGEIPAMVYTGPVRHPMVICSIAHGEKHVAMLRSMAPTIGYYCGRHGMDSLLLPNTRFDSSRPPAWDKVILIRNLLEYYETVLWIDSDAIICDPRHDIRDELDPACPMHIVAHRYDGRVNPNTGVWAVQRDERAIDLLEEMWSHTELVDNPWWEQAALMDLIGYDPRGCSSIPFGPPPFARLVRFLDRKWNSIRQDPAESPVIKHFPGEPMDVRQLGLQIGFGEFLAKAVQPSPGEGRAEELSNPAVPPVPPESGALGSGGFLSKREHLPALLNLRGLQGPGVEVGVKQGLFSEHILRRWRGELLISVDPWLEDAAESYVDIANVPQGQHEIYYQETLGRLSSFGERSSVWRMTSLEASAAIPDGSLDFVYLDARHDYAAVMEDLLAWFPKVKPGGIIAGHDYLDGLLPEGDFGVKSAVDEFFASKGLCVHSTLHDHPWTSWIVEIDPKALTAEAGACAGHTAAIPA